MQAQVTPALVTFIEHRETVINYIRKQLMDRGDDKLTASMQVVTINMWPFKDVENLHTCIENDLEMDQDVIEAIVMHDFYGLRHNDEFFVPKSKQFEGKAVCDDCRGLFNKSDLSPYKYEPGFKLCESCLDDRMEEE